MRGVFLTELKYSRVKDSGKIFIKLHQPLVYRDSKGNKHSAKKGFLSDGASIPKIAWSIVGHPFGLYLESAVIHDVLCEKENVKGSFRDWVLLDAMRAQRIPFWKRQVMHKMVRVYTVATKNIPNLFKRGKK